MKPRSLEVNPVAGADKKFGRRLLQVMREVAPDCVCAFPPRVLGELSIAAFRVDANQHYVGAWSLKRLAFLCRRGEGENV